MVISRSQMKSMGAQTSNKLQILNSLLPSDTIWWHGSGSTLAQVMACCLMASSCYLDQCYQLGSVAFIQDLFHRKCSRYQFVKWVWKTQLFPYSALGVVTVMATCPITDIPIFLGPTSVFSLDLVHPQAMIRLLHSPGVVAGELSVDMRHGLQLAGIALLWLVGQDIGWDCLSHNGLWAYMASGNFHHV